jgi:hypothetical protein
LSKVEATGIAKLVAVVVTMAAHLSGASRVAIAD